MTTYLDTLRPSEKRLVVGVGLVLFVMANFWFVVPHFSDAERLNFRTRKAQEKLEKYNNDIQQAKRYEADMKRMEGGGYAVPPEEQSMHFQSTVQEMASQAGLVFQSVGHVSQRTNQFFLEISEPVTLTTKEETLVTFLYNLGSGDSLIRVRDLGLRTDAPRQNLSATIKLVASYQKKLPTRAGASSPLPATTSKRP